MPIGYGYIRDEEPSIVDWGKISKDAIESLRSIEEDRKKKREAVEEGNQELLKDLRNRPPGQNPEYQKTMSVWSEQISATMLESYRALRLGTISLELFNRRRNTTKSDVQGTLEAAKIYTEQYAENVKRAQQGGSGYEIAMNAIAQELFEFQGVETIVDPQTGAVSFIKRNQDGSTQTVDASELFSMSTIRQDKYDLTGAMTTYLEAVKPVSYQDEHGRTVTGKFLEKIEVIDPKTGKPTGEFEYIQSEDAIDKAAQALITQPAHLYGVLNDWIGGYDFVRLDDEFYKLSPEEQTKELKRLQEENDKSLYIDTVGNVHVSEDQKKIAYEYVRGQLQSAAGVSEKEAPYLGKELTDEELQNKELFNDIKTLEYNALVKAAEGSTLTAEEMFVQSRGWVDEMFPETKKYFIDKNRPGVGKKREAKNLSNEINELIDIFGLVASQEGDKDTIVIKDGDAIVFKITKVKSKSDAEINEKIRHAIKQYYTPAELAMKYRGYLADEQNNPTTPPEKKSLPGQDE